MRLWTISATSGTASFVSSHGVESMTNTNVIRDAIRALTRERAPKSICPSEAARRVAGEDGDWRSLMPAVRKTAGALAANGEIVITQRGQPVDLSAVRGPVRLCAAAGKTVSVKPAKR